MNNLIVIHGALGSARQLDELCQAYEEYYDVFSFDLSGHGGLPINERFSIDLFTKDLQHFIVVNELEGADVFGYSMGGYIALNHARLHPGKLGRIITLGTKFHWNPAEAEKEIRRLNADLIEQKLPKFASALEERHAPAIDWGFRFQRPQHLAFQLGARGYRVFYVSTVPMLVFGSGGYIVQDNPVKGVVLVQLSSGKSRTPDFYKENLTTDEVAGFLKAYAALCENFGIVDRKSVV